MTATVNVLTVAVAGPAAQPRLTEAGRQPARLYGPNQNVSQTFFVVVNNGYIYIYNIANSHHACLEFCYKIVHSAS